MVPLLIWQAFFFALYCCLLLTILLYLYSGRRSNAETGRRSRAGSVSHTRNSSSDIGRCDVLRCCPTVTVKELILCTLLVATFCRILWLLDPRFESQSAVLRPQSSAASRLFSVVWTAGSADALYLLSVILLTAAFVLLVLYYRQTVKSFESLNGAGRPSIYAMRQLVCSATALMALMLLLTVPFLIAEELVQKGDEGEMSEAGYIVAFVFVVGLSCAGLWYARRIRRLHFDSIKLRRFSRKVQAVAASGLAMTIVLGAAFVWRWRYIARLALPDIVLASPDHTTSCAGGAAHTTWCKNYVGFVWLTSLLEVGLYGLLLISIHPNWTNMVRKRMSRASATIINMFGAGSTPAGSRGSVGDSRPGAQSRWHGDEQQAYAGDTRGERESLVDNDANAAVGLSHQNPTLEVEAALSSSGLDRPSPNQAPRPIPNTSFQHTDGDRTRRADRRGRGSDDVELSSSFRSDGISSFGSGTNRIQQSMVAEAFASAASSVPSRSRAGNQLQSQSRIGQLSSSAGTAYQLMNDED